MSFDPRRKSRYGDEKPKIWAEGSQHPPFELRVIGRASLYLARETVAPVHAWFARRLRQSALKLRDGEGRIPEARLGRAARFVPSHQRVAMWLKNLALVQAHASATADPDVKRGNALVTEIAPHLWEVAPPPSAPAPAPAPAPEPIEASGQDEADPLAALRSELSGGSSAPVRSAPTPRATPAAKAGQPPPTGEFADTVIQVVGYLLGWATTIVVLPYGLARALFGQFLGQDLRKLGQEE